MPYMQESLSNAEYAMPQRQEFDFEGYDSEPNPEDSFEKAEVLTLQAISAAPAFTGRNIVIKTTTPAQTGFAYSVP